jgi:hypothetical protein
MIKFLFLVICVLLFSGSAQAQTIYSHMSAESGNMSQWSATIRDMNSGGNSDFPTASQTRVKNGSWAYKFEMPKPTVSTCCDWNYTMVHSYSPNLQSMGSPNGRYLSGYYSFWLYIDAGFQDSPGDWLTLLNWFTNDPTAGLGVIANIELRRWPSNPAGPLQLAFLMKAADAGCFVPPTISGYQRAGSGYYFMTSSSPAGIVTFPRFQWVHVEVHYVRAASGGQIQIYQDGVLIMDLTHANLNTIMNARCINGQDMFIQFGMYSGAKNDGAYRFYMDDFKVSDVRLTPTGNATSSVPAQPTNLSIK